MKFGSLLLSKPKKRCESTADEDDEAEDDAATLPLPMNSEFRYEKGVCALEYWEPVKLLGEGSISDIHLVRRRSKRIHVRYKKKRDIMKFAKEQTLKESGSGSFDRAAAAAADERELYVLKSIMKDHVDSDQVLEEMRRELHTMSKLEHPNIVKLYEAYERRRHIYLVMDYCSGGNLTDRHFSEKQCAVVVRKILSAVGYMHSMGVVHRDLKLENILMDRVGEIKIIDFGLATKYLSEEHKVMTDRVGTLYTMAPQVLQGVYTSQCDLWSIGVITYMLLSGNNPFWGPPRPMPWSDRRKIMMDRIMRCQYQRMTGPSWDLISSAAIQFCQSLLQMDPDDRPTALEALESEWIHSVDDIMKYINVVSKQERNSRKALENFQRVAILLLAQESTPDQVMKFRTKLETYDFEGNGRIQLIDFQKALQQETGIAPSRIADLFVDKIDMTFPLAYNDFCIKVLADQDRSITEKAAEALDSLDVEGTRKVDKDQLQATLEGILSSNNLLNEILRELKVDKEGKVSTIQVLELLDSALVNRTRRSLRTVGSQHDGEKELVDAKDVIIPGGLADLRQNQKYVYEAKDKSVRRLE